MNKNTQNSETDDENTKVCTIAQNPCYTNAKQEFSTKVLVKKCNCLPDCFSITYNVEISQSQLRHLNDEQELKTALNRSKYLIIFFNAKT